MCAQRNSGQVSNHYKPTKLDRNVINRYAVKTFYDHLQDLPKHELVDIGANISKKRFPDVVEVIKRSLDVGVKTIILTGTSIESSELSCELAKQYPNTLYSTVGVHPHDAKLCNAHTISQLTKLASQPEVVSLGECGLDFDRNYSPREEQEKWFKNQLDLARKLDKPVFLHERAASKRFVEIYSTYKDLIPRSVVHCFTGTRAQLETYLKLGFYIGITGWICDERRGKHLQDIVKLIPLDKLMIETDAPFLTPHNMPVKAQRNEPCFLPYVLKKISECVGVPEAKIAEQTTQNALKFFAIDKKREVKLVE